MIEGGEDRLGFKALCQAAERALAARKFDAAEQKYRQIVAEIPNHVVALRALSQLASRLGRHDEAIDYAERALRHCEIDADSVHRSNYASVLRKSGRLGDAVIEYDRILEVMPDNLPIRINQAILLRASARSPEAEQHLRYAAAIQPALETLLLLALTLLDQDRFQEAENLCRSVLASENDSRAWNILGIALKETGRPSEASHAFATALRLSPDFVDAAFNLAGAFKDGGRAADAMRTYREVIALAPDLAAVRVAACMAPLSPLYRSEEEILASRVAYESELADLEVWAASDPTRLAAGVGASQPFYLAYQGRPDAALQKRYGALICRAMAAAYPSEPLARRPLPGERIRVGFVSGFFRDHSNWWLPLRGWLEGLDRRDFEIFGYHTGVLVDDETLRARSLCEHFVQGPLPFDAWRVHVAEGRLHILIYPEVGMDPVAARLAALRLAPIQCNSWGHPTTSGYPTLDHFLSSDLMEPQNAQSHYIENLIRLPGLSTNIYPPNLLPPAVPRAKLGLSPDDAVFWCGQSLYKYLPAHDGVFAAIARLVPNSRFVFIEFPGSTELTQRFSDRLQEAFASAGLSANDHCIILPRLDPRDFIATMRCCDVALDSLGWSGCNSLIDAVAAGLPIVTHPGPLMRGRHGAALLTALGAQGEICATVEDYIQSAATYAERRHSTGGTMKPSRITGPKGDFLGPALRDLIEKSFGS